MMKKNYLGILILGNQIDTETVRELQKVTRADEITVLDSSTPYKVYETTLKNSILLFNRCITNPVCYSNGNHL